MRKLILIPLCVLFFALGCKTRQVNKSSEALNTETNSSTEVKESLTDKSNETATTETTKETTTETSSVTTASGIKFTPADKDKPMGIEDAQGNKYSITNGVAEFTNSTTETQTKQTVNEHQQAETAKQNDINQKNDIKGNSRHKSNYEADNKDVISEPASLLDYWWIVLLILLAIVIAWNFKGFKKLLNQF